MFAADYAGQFDAVLPGLSRLAMPLPLGGSSNHFRAGMLRSVGGWDAHNVTEDADLGFRLARFGARAITFDSVTAEEAPAGFGPWLRQRSRWMKGWMQTWSVHMRHPVRLWREAGWRGVLGLNLLLGGNLVAALAFGVIAMAAIAAVICGLTGRPTAWLAAGLLTPLYLATMVCGYLTTALIGIVGLRRRGRMGEGWIYLLTPFYWACLSLATWRALWQLLHDPHRWEKTEHGAAPARRTHASARQRGSSIIPDLTNERLAQPHRLNAGGTAYKVSRSRGRQN